MTFSRSLAALGCCAVLAACSMDKNAVQTIAGPAPGSAVKFYNFSPGAPSVNFYANDTKVTAVSSTSGVESTAGTAYGSVATGGFYTALTPGQYTITGRITATTDNGLAIVSAPAALADGKYYSFFLSGPYNTATKKSDFFMLEDAAPPAQLDYAVAYVRFVNAISNSSPMTLYVKSTTSGTELPVGGSVAYKSAGALTPIPIGPYDLIARVTGSTGNAITLAAVGFTPGRVLTVTARGDMTITSTTAATRPILTSSTDR
jgi:hypothetical protein